MKTFKYIAMAAIAATMVSCDDFFDTESPSAMTISFINRNLRQRLL
jgi:hypothetical protein